MPKKLRERLRAFFKRSKTHHSVIVEEMPGNLKPGILYIFDNAGYHWQMVMLCPCGCGDVLFINLVDTHNPYWKYYLDNRSRITLRPSLHRKDRCRSHFFITKNKINWCNY